MAINLTSYKNIGSALIVKLEIPQYSTTAGGPYSSQTLRFSDFIHPISVAEPGGNFDYKGVGNLLGISPTRSEIKTSTNEITLSLSGIPNSSIAEIHNSKIKGSRISIWRLMFDATTYVPLAVSGNPVGRFFGVVTNYNLDETWDNRTSINTINLICSTWMDILSSKVVGRKTNPVDQQLFYPGDTSMDRVPNLTGANYNFGQYTG